MCLIEMTLSSSSSSYKHKVATNGTTICPFCQTFHGYFLTSIVDIFDPVVVEQPEQGEP